MKVRKYSASDEKTILTALIVHDSVLARIYERMAKAKNPFRNKWANLICRWCFGYFERYRKAPAGVIQSLFTRFAERERDQAVVELVEQFLASLSGAYKHLSQELNEEFVIDAASKYFRTVQLERMAEAIQVAVERKDLDEAEMAFLQHEPINFASNNRHTPFSKASVLKALRQEDEESLIDFPSPLDKFLTPFLKRTDFVSFAGPEKRGKSFWLQEIVWQAICQRRRVLYYVLGDMSAEDVDLRFYRRITGKTMPPQVIEYPKLIEWDGKDDKGRRKVRVKREDRKIEMLTPGAVKKAMERLRVKTACKKPRLEIICDGGSVISASKIENEIEQASKDGWPPDVVVIDYADELAPEPQTLKMDFRHQVNQTWRVLRRIALKNHCLVVTATQTAARSYDAWVIRKRDFSEDKRKNAHVTGMIGINQTSEEKEHCIYRLNWINLRHGKWVDTQCCWTAGNLAIANPCIRALL
jgi:hypothetical protein